MGTGLLLLLLSSVWALSSAKSVFVSPEAGSSNTTTFYQAVLQPQVTDIVLTSNYTLGDEFSQYKASPLQVNRNITVTGLHGTDDVLDLQFALSKVELCPTCTWTWRNITVANERRGGGPAWDFFVGPQGGPGFPVDGKALVIGENMVRLRLACAAAKYTKDIIKTNQRPSIVNATKPQNYTVTTVNYQGFDYPETLVLYDHGAVIPRVIQEGRGVTGGYGVWDHNVVRLCLDTVGDDCLAIRSPEACVNERIDRILAQQAAAPAAGTLPAGPLAAAIVVPILAAVALLAVLGIIWRYRRQHRLEQQQFMHEGKLPQLSPGAGGEHVQRWLDAGDGQADGPEATPNDYQGPMAARRGWELTSSLTSPLVGDVEDGRIIFGDLLGAGSFGRVYRGQWAGRTVAIKVIEYDASSRSEVQNEVQLVLSFNHPNIVHAYHCVTYTCTGGTTGSDSKISDRAINGANNNHKVTAAAGAAGAPVAAIPQRRGSTDSSTTALLPTTMQQQHAYQADGQQQADKRVSARDLSTLVELPSRAAGGNSNLASAAAQQGSPSIGSSNLQQQPVIGGDAGAQADKDQECWTIAEKEEKDSWQVQALGVVVGPARVETWLVQEYCDCGTLGNVANRLRESGSADSMLKLVLLLFDVANGLKVLHSRMTVHGDLNARNVLVASVPTSATGYAAKLADLGLSRVMAKHRTHRTTDTVGTMSHMPPELLRYGKQSPAGDIYAFGIMMWELYTGRQAFKDLHYGQFFEEIVLNNVRPPLPQGMPSDYLLLMDHCWAADPADRPGVDRLLQCIEFMLQERQRTTGSTRRSSAVLPATPCSTSTQASSAGTGTPGFTAEAGGFFN